MASLASNIAAWAYGNESRIEQVREWQETALMTIATAGGQQVVQTSANGVSVAFASGMTNQAWFDTLTQALAILESGTLPPKKKQAIFPCDC